MVAPQSSLANAMLQMLSWDNQDIVNPQSGFDQSAMLTSYPVRDWCLHIPQGCITGTGAIMQCGNEMGSVNQ